MLIIDVFTYIPEKLIAYIKIEMFPIKLNILCTSKEERSIIRKQYLVIFPKKYYTLSSRSCSIQNHSSFRQVEL